MSINIDKWTIGDTFYYLQYRESFPGLLGEFCVKRDKILDFYDASSVRGADGLRHHTDMTPSEQHARNVAADRNTLLAMSWKISL